MKQIRVPILGRTLVLMGREQSAIVFEPELRGRLIKGPNHPKVWGFGKTTAPDEIDLGRLAKKAFAREVEMIKPDGVVLSRKVITSTGVTFLRDDWNANTKDITNMNAHGNGTGTVAESSTDTALGTEVETRVSGTKTTPAGNQLQTQATISITNTRAITEHGIFDSTTTAGSTLWDRSVFTAINVVNLDSIQYTYVCTISAGG